MKIHHIGILTDDIQAGIRHHQDLFDIHPTTEIVEDPIQKVLVVMLSGSEMGDTQIELIQPTSNDSPVANAVKKGSSLYHLCFEVEHLDETLRKTRAKGSLVISHPTPAKLFDGRRIAFIYGPDHYVVEFLESSHKLSTRTNTFSGN